MRVELRVICSYLSPGSLGGGDGPRDEGQRGLFTGRLASATGLYNNSEILDLLGEAA
jgi:hypothetical protein